MSLFQCSQQLTEPIHGRLEIFQDVLRQFLRGGEIVQIGQSLVLDPEDIQAGFIPIEDLLGGEAPPAAVQVVLAPGLVALIAVFRVVRLGNITFEDADLTGHDEPEQVRGESYACWELRQIIQDDTLPLADRDGVAEELERLAERGDTHAQYLMGLLYRDGPLLIPDSRRTKHWLVQAAKQNLPEAQYALGKLLLSDDPEVRDPDEGIRWLKEAAAPGNYWAAYWLGKEYLTGEVLTKDTAKAVDWFTQSAEADNQYAQYMLGKLYLTGQGMTHDQTQAMNWFSRSAAQGNQYAQFFLERQSDLHPPSVMLAVTRLLYHMSRIFEDHSLPQSSAGLHVDRKLRRRIQEKKIALGHKPDDHEEELIQTWGGMTMK